MSWTQTGLCVAFTCAALGALPLAAASFRRGDLDGDAGLNLSDAELILESLFAARATTCDDALDANDDGRADVSDAIYLLLFLFDRGGAPREPFLVCGADPTEDELDCAAYPGCPPPTDCLSASEASANLAAAIPRVVCIPADVGSFLFEPLVVEVCPGAAAVPCGASQEPGCPVGITSLEVELDRSAGTATFRVEGSAVDLPVLVTEAIFGGRATCLAALPFAVDVSVPLVLEDAGGGAARVLGLGEPVFEDVAVDVAATGGFICSLFASVRDQIIGVLTAQVEDVASQLLEEAGAALVGTVLCPDE